MSIGKGDYRDAAGNLALGVFFGIASLSSIAHSLTVRLKGDTGGEK